MRLADAIRAGAAKRPQTCGPWFDFTAGGTLRSCAITAALEGAGAVNLDNAEERERCSYSFAREVFPRAAFLEMVMCPVCDFPMSFLGVVAHLNDLHRWKRERIADWVEEHEAALQMPKNSLEKALEKMTEDFLGFVREWRERHSREWRERADRVRV